MTVFDLVNAAPFCDLVEIVVRENGTGQWIQGYRISKDAKQYPAEYSISDGKRHYTYKSKVESLKNNEERDVQRGFSCNLKIICKDVSKIPDYIGNLNVAYYQPRHIPCVHKEALTHNEFALDINCYPEGYVPEVPEEQKKSKSEQLEGQTSLFDFMEG